MVIFDQFMLQILSRLPSSLVSKSSGDSKSSRATPSPLIMVPSQFHEPLEESSLSESLLQASQSTHASVARIIPVRQVMSLASVPENDHYPQVYTGVDNTIFLYPTSFEKFKHRYHHVEYCACNSIGYLHTIFKNIFPFRNLCLRVYFVELERGANLNETLHDIPRRLLRNIYSNLPGELFSDHANTQVTYHERSPVLNEEIKIRLPIVLTNKHYLLFEVIVKSDFRIVIYLCIYFEKYLFEHNYKFF